MKERVHAIYFAKFENENTQSDRRMICFDASLGGFHEWIEENRSSLETEFGAKFIVDNINLITL